MENDPLVREGLDEVDDDEGTPVVGSTEDDGWDEEDTEPEEDEELL